MSTTNLKKHYEQKYEQESEHSSIKVIKNVDVPTTRFEAVIKYFPKYFSKGNILELGAGSGIVANSLLKSDLNISSYTASDISQPRLIGLQNNINDKRFDILEMDAERLPNQYKNQFNAIIMVALIEHLIDPLRAMKNINKLLKPDGFIYIDTPNIAKYTRRLKLLFGKFPSTASKNEGLSTYSGEKVDLYDEGHLHYFSYRSLSLMLMERCGYSKIEKLGYHSGKPFLGKHLLGFLANNWKSLFSELVIIAYA